MMRALIVIGLFVATAGNASAQLSIRQSFAAASHKTKPASFLWTKESAPEEVSFGTIDVGVRYNFESSGGLLIAGPVAEWHRLTRTGKEKDVLSLGGAAELIVDQLALGWFGSPYLSGQLTYENDRVKEIEGVSFSAAATTFSTRRWAPGSQNELWGGSMFRYYPHLGIERYGPQPDSVGPTTLATATLNVEFWPVKGRVQITASYVAPWTIGNTEVGEDLDRRSVGANVYLDDSGQVGFGLEHLDSSDPAEAFKRVKRTVFGFKVKL